MDIKKIIEKKGKLTQVEIDFIIAEGAKVGVEPPAKTDCANCWRDMAIEVAYKQRQSNDTKKAHRLRGDAARYGVIHKGRLITNDIIDDELLDWMQANDFPTQLLEDAEN